MQLQKNLLFLFIKMLVLKRRYHVQLFLYLSIHAIFVNFLLLRVCFVVCVNLLFNMYQLGYFVANLNVAANKR
jgi:hypothetical protein